MNNIKRKKKTKTCVFSVRRVWVQRVGAGDGAGWWPGPSRYRTDRGSVTLGSWVINTGGSRLATTPRLQKHTRMISDADNRTLTQNTAEKNVTAP